LVSIAITPLGLAVPWNPKNNEKFQTFETVLTIDPTPIMAATPQYVPSEDKPNKIIISWDEAFFDYSITIGGDYAYYLHDDFEYSGVAVYTTIGKEYEPNPLTGFPVGDKETKFRVDYMYDFGPDDGNPDTLDGTLQMLAITATPDTMFIRNLRGTGDLKNVQIISTAVGYAHSGLVIGWPDIAPNPSP
jgi:hypothetical protein